MKKITVTMLMLLPALAFSQKKEEVPFCTQNKVVEVYTTAENTDLRLTKSNEKLIFSEMKQPLETQTCVFVNPNKTFQTFLNILT